MAIPYGQLEEFAALWHDELGVPFAVYGVIPNYVKRDKFELLTWAGMNRVRMGIQSGSKTCRLLPGGHAPEKILNAAGSSRRSRPGKKSPRRTKSSWTTVETRDDVKSTLQLLYMMDSRNAVHLLVKVIPNTGLATAMKERGATSTTSRSYLAIPPRAANLMLYMRAVAPAAVAVEPADGPRPRVQRAQSSSRAWAGPRRCTSPSACSRTWGMDFSITPARGLLAWKVVCRAVAEALHAAGRPDRTKKQPEVRSACR